MDFEKAKSIHRTYSSAIEVLGRLSAFTRENKPDDPYFSPSSETLEKFNQLGVENMSLEERQSAHATLFAELSIASDELAESATRNDYTFSDEDERETIDVITVSDTDFYLRRVVDNQGNHRSISLRVEGEASDTDLTNLSTFLGRISNWSYLFYASGSADVNSKRIDRKILKVLDAQETLTQIAQAQ